MKRSTPCFCALFSTLLGAFFTAPIAAQPTRHLDALRAEIQRLEQAASSGGWATIPDGPTLRQGDSGERVAALRQRLAQTGDLQDAGGDRYDAALAEAVQRAQQRHGLAVDGVAGPQTFGALAVSPGERARQARESLERQERFVAEHASDHFVLVNVPAFRLHYVAGGSPRLTMPVIVGKEGWGTPEMHESIEYLVANPDWDVPQSILVEDLAPKIREDLGYLEDNDMVILEGWGEDARRVDPTSVDWSNVGQGFPYHVRQLPGPENPLGQLKFMFPNDDNIYLHGTPHTHLFDRDDRGLSHGCIRVERPLDLGAALLAGNPEWDRERLASFVEGDEQQRIDLDEPVPVHLVYWPVVARADGTVEFHQDIYDRL